MDRKRADKQLPIILTVIVSEGFVRMVCEINIISVAIYRPVEIIVLMRETLVSEKFQKIVASLGSYSGDGIDKSHPGFRFYQIYQSWLGSQEISSRGETDIA